MAGPIDTRVDPTVGQRPRHQQAALVVRAQRHHHRAAALRRRRPAGVPGLPAAHLVREHEPRTPPERAPRALPAPRRRRRGSGRRSPRRSTTSTSRCSTSPPSSTWRRSSTCSRSTASPAACSSSRAAAVDPGRDPPHRAAHRRGRARRHLLARPDLPRPRPLHATSGRCASATTCSPASGHYGVFNGRRWEQQIYPLVHNLILANS